MPSQKSALKKNCILSSDCFLKSNGFFLRRFTLKTGCVLNLVLPDMVARSYIEEPNYQRERADIYLGYWCILTVLAPFFTDQNTVLSGALKKDPFCLQELSSVDCGLLINLSEHCYSSWLQTCYKTAPCSVLFLYFLKTTATYLFPNYIQKLNSMSFFTHG